MGNHRIAVVADDVELNRELLHDILEDEFVILEAENGLQVMDIIRKREQQISVLLLDLVMPEMNGFQVLEHLRAENLMNAFPVLIISGESELTVEERCLGLGVTDFIHKPFAPSLVRHRIRNAVTMFASRDELARQVAEKTAELQERNRQLARSNEDTIELMGDVVEARSLESGTHVRRVKGFTRILGEYLLHNHPELELSQELVDSWTTASAMHDLGKIMVPDQILLKPGRFTPEEFAEMKRHTLYGCTMLENSRRLWEDAYYRLCWDICRYHHEKYDGNGYPEGLSGDQIPLVAQVVSVADCFDALTTERVYKRAFTPEEAFQMILGGACGAFSPLMLDALRECEEPFRKLAIEIKSFQPSTRM